MLTKDLVTHFGAIGDGIADDAPAVRRFNEWARQQTDSITLTLGAGSRAINFASTDSNFSRGNSFAYSVKVPLVVAGNGPQQTILKGKRSHFFLGTGDGIKSGNGHFGNSSSWTARLATALAGETSIRCLRRQDVL